MITTIIIETIAIIVLISLLISNRNYNSINRISTT